MLRDQGEHFAAAFSRRRGRDSPLARSVFAPREIQFILVLTAYLAGAAACWAASGVASVSEMLGWAASMRWMTAVVMSMPSAMP